MLLERNEVKVEVFDAILLKQVLTEKASEVDARFGKGSGMVFIKGGVSLDGGEVAAVVRHVEGLLPLITSRRVP